MPRAIGELQSDITNKLSNIRAILRIILSDKFNRAYKIASEKRKVELEYYINCHYKRHITNWIRDILDDQNIFELREEGKKLGLPNYNKMPKFLLKEEICQARKKNTQLI